MKNYKSYLWMIGVLCLFLMASTPANERENYNSVSPTTDTWQSIATVDSAGTYTATWPKSVRAGSPGGWLSVEMDTSAQSGLDTITVQTYTSIFQNPVDDQWETDTTFEVYRGSVAPVTVKLTNEFRNVKFTATSKDTVSNTISWVFWVK